MDALGWVQMSLQRSSGVCIRANVQCFHTRKFIPLTHVVLMAFDVFPDERKRKTPSDFDDFVHCVAFGSQASTGKDRGRSEFSGDALYRALVVSGDADSRVRGRTVMERNVK
jgi:hypothetical protein